jgi:hypothetical protein
MGGMNPGYASNNMSHSSFGHPATQAAFSGADNQGQNAPPQNGFYGNEATPDPFAFLSNQLGGLNMNNENEPSRRNGNPQGAKSPA